MLTHLRPAPPILTHTRSESWRWLALLTGAVVASSACSGRPAETDQAGDAPGDTAAQPSADAASRSEALGDRDYGPVAEKVVGQSAIVQEGDVVLIMGRDEDLPLLEDLAIAVSKQGGSSIVTVSTERMQRRMYDEVPAKYDSVTPEATLKLASAVDVFIAMEAGEQRTLKGVPSERMAARSAAFEPVIEAFRKRGVRQVLLGNGLYPTAERAEQLDVSRRELADALYGGVDVDYAQLQTTGEQIRRVLAGGKQVRITAPNGTDLRVRIAGRPAYVSDGVISAEDRRRGGPATSVWLPAGEVYVVPGAGSVEGVLVADELFFEGERIEGLRLEFKAGKLASMTAKSGLEALKARYDAAGRGKDIVGVLDLGINPGLKLPADKPMHVWSRAGMVTVGLGNNVWAGGDNNVAFGLTPYVPNGTVEVDGKVVIRDGKLLAAERLAAR
jgi:aminopeptidase